jgi:hypothetical protein
MFLPLCVALACFFMVVYAQELLHDECMYLCTQTLNLLHRERDRSFVKTLVLWSWRSITKKHNCQCYSILFMDKKPLASHSGVLCTSL